MLISYRHRNSPAGAASVGTVLEEIPSKFISLVSCSNGPEDDLVDSPTGLQSPALAQAAIVGGQLVAGDDPSAANSNWASLRGTIMSGPVTALARRRAPRLGSCSTDWPSSSAE